MEILPGVPLSLCLQGAWKGVDFPPGSSLHVFSLISAFSGTLGPLSTSLCSWETQPSPSEIIPPAKNSLHQHSGVGLSHGACLPQVSCPWSSCAGIKMGRGSSAVGHSRPCTHPMGCVGSWAGLSAPIRDQGARQPAPPGS